MYQFRDVNEVSEGTTLPSEALQINGEYIENLIEGYKTLYVSGREALSPDVVSYETGIRDGSRLKTKRYPERIITVAYQIVANSNEEFREAYNKLGEILNVEAAELIFADETDKFFVGTPCSIGEVTPGKNAVVGEFEILCTDPFKYSVLEYEAEAEAASEDSLIMVDYNGTYKSFPKLEASFFNENETSADGETETPLTGNGDCGFVAFFNEKEKIIQLGDPEEVDGVEAYAASQTLINQKFENTNSWGTATQRLWTANNGITTSSGIVQAGSVAMKVASSKTVTSGTKAKETSQQLLRIQSRAESPYITYTVKVKTFERKSDRVKLTFTITGELGGRQSYFLSGYALTANIKIGNSNNIDIRVKKTSDLWRGQTAHSASKTVTIYDLSPTQTKITGITFKVSRADNTGGQTGIVSTMNCPDITISAADSSSSVTTNTYYLTADNYGSGSGWHGPSITRAIPADASGEVGANRCNLTFSHKMCIGSGNNGKNQRGAFEALLVSGSGSNRRIAAGVSIYKNSEGKTAKMRFYVNNNIVATYDIDLSNNNTHFNSDKTARICVNASQVIFEIGGKRQAYKDNGLLNNVVKQVTFTMTKYGSYNELSYNGLYWAKLVKNNCETWKDIPNKFSTGDIVEANCKDGTILLNGVQTPALGALGNDWEDFYLQPGVNQIGFAYSDWVTSAYAPQIKVKYREVFL